MALIDLLYVRHFERGGEPVLSAEVRAHSKHRVREQPVLFQFGFDGDWAGAGGSVEAWVSLLRRQATVVLLWRWRPGSWVWKRADRCRQRT